MPFHLFKHEDPNAGLRRVALEQIDIAVDGFADNTIPLGRKVHSLRARCKKLRGMLRLVRPMLGDEVYKDQDAQYRAAAKELAGSRDRDVALKTLGTLGIETESHGHADVPADSVTRSLEILSACRAAVDAWPLAVAGFDELAPGFSRTYTKCLDAWAAVQLDPTDLNYHQLRKNAKYHWYHVRVLERINKKKIRERRHKLRDLQLTLGDAHDLYMLQSFLRGNTDYALSLYEQATARKHALYGRGAELASSVFAQTADEIEAEYASWWAESRGEG